MEEWNVLTYRDYDFSDEKGRTIKGRTLHCTRPNTGDGWPGVEYTKLSISAGTLAYEIKPELNRKYRFQFDRRGKVTEMQLVNEK